MSDEIKHMADILKSGAIMLSEMCPECNTPLFKKEEQIFCPKCNKPVIIIKSPEEEDQFNASLTLANLERTVLKRLQEADAALKINTDTTEMSKLSSTIVLWLTILEKLRKLR